MSVTLLQCLLGLFGLDLLEEDSRKAYKICQTSCVCELGKETEDPICTDVAIMDKFCPHEWFVGADSSTSTSTTTTVLEV
jgi:hypothetical protein